MRPQPTVGQLWVHAWFFEFVLCVCVCVCVRVCVCVCTYLPTYLPIYLSVFVRTTACIQPTISFCTSKLWLEGGFHLKAKKQVWWLAKDIESGFHSGIFWHATTEKHCSRPVGLTRNHILSLEKRTWPVLMWTKIKSSLEALLEEFSKNHVPERL